MWIEAILLGLIRQFFLLYLLMFAVEERKERQIGKKGDILTTKRAPEPLQNQDFCV